MLRLRKTAVSMRKKIIVTEKSIARDEEITGRIIERIIAKIIVVITETIIEVTIEMTAKSMVNEETEMTEMNGEIVEDTGSITKTGIKIKPGERIDDLERNGYSIIQSKARFCFGMDAVLLSGFAQVKKGERVLDLGTGTGIIPILLEAKTQGEHFTGLEIQEESADMARRSVLLNQLQDKIDIVTGDIKDASNIFGASSFDVITTNPPYMIGQHGLQNADEAKTIARHEVLCTLEDIIAQSAKLLPQKGRFYMVHRPFRLVEIFTLMHQYGIEPKRMKMVHPYVDKEPNMVLIEGLRGGNARLTVEKPVIVFNESGKYTEEITEVYGY